MYPFDPEPLDILASTLENEATSWPDNDLFSPSDTGMSSYIKCLIHFLRMCMTRLFNWM